MVRKLLYEAANSFLTRSRGSFALKRWVMKIARRRRLRKARVALARRLTVVMTPPGVTFVLGPAMRWCLD